MINVYDILETIRMIQDECLDIRTITMGISLLDCIDSDIDKACEKVYNKITSKAKDLVKTGERIEKEYGIPFSNAVDYRMEKQGKESEKINMMMVATKENIPFTEEVTYQNVLKWVYSIPNDKRCAFYDMILIK